MAKSPTIYIDESLKEKKNIEVEKEEIVKEERGEPSDIPTAIQPTTTLTQEIISGVLIAILSIIYFIFFPDFIEKVFSEVKDENLRNLFTAIFYYPIFAAGYYLFFSTLPRGKKGIAILLLSLVMIVLSTSGLVCSNKKNEKNNEIEQLKRQLEITKQTQPRSRYSKNLHKTLLPGDDPYPVDTLKKGQFWHFPAFNGTFYFRVDKGDDKACWKKVTNNDPWTADWDGELQIKAGNTPVDVSISIQK
jgi:hypothetical protein